MPNFFISLVINLTSHREIRNFLPHFVNQAPGLSQLLADQVLFPDHFDFQFETLIIPKFVGQPAKYGHRE